MAGTFAGECQAQSSVAAASTALTITIAGSGVAAGQLAVLPLGAREGAAALTAVGNDSKGNTWGIAYTVANVGGNTVACQAYCVPTTPLVAGDTVPLTFSAAIGTGRIWWLELFNGMQSQATVLDTGAVATSQNGTNPDTSGTTGATAQADEIAVANFAGLSTAYSTLANSFLTFPTATINSGGAQSREGIAGYKILTSTGTVVTNTNTTTSNGPGGVACYKAAAVTSGPRSRIVIPRRVWAGR